MQGFICCEPDAGGCLQDHLQKVVCISCTEDHLLGSFVEGSLQGSFTRGCLQSQMQGVICKGLFADGHAQKAMCRELCAGSRM